MARVISSLILGSLFAGLAIAIHAARPADPALACTGGLSIEFAAGSSIIVLGDAIAVGDEVNRASTFTPTATSTATPIPSATPIFRSETAPAVTPVSPPVAPAMPHGPYPTPEGFTLAGYGVTLQVVRNFGGAQRDLAPAGGTIDVDRETREGIEHELRQYETGTGGISNCPIAAFIPKYVAGVRYVVFAGRPDEAAFGLFTTYRARVEGTDVILNGPTIPFDEQATLYVTAEQYHRFFDGVEADFRSPDFVAITADRVPLTSVLRYAASINGSAVRIAPPETGSAGLLDPSPATTTQR